MPTYHYKCKSCKHEFEELQTMSEDALVLCPSCKKHS
ncbi:MAG: zinc ribbon domain-containing protein [Bacteroidota bacterium]|nr:zinc ribbon domain-containing protein [Bacteroidota bacterium]